VKYGFIPVGDVDIYKRLMFFYEKKMYFASCLMLCSFFLQARHSLYGSMICVYIYQLLPQHQTWTVMIAPMGGQSCDLLWKNNLYQCA